MPQLSSQLETVFQTTAQSDVRTYYEWAPLVPLNQWWHLAVLTCALAAMTWLVVMIYRRDSRALPSGTAILLTSLRVLAFLGLLVFVLSPQRRSESRIVKPSELAILIDTSLSMGLADVGTSAAGEPLRQPSRRIDSVTETLSQSELLDELNRNHELTIYRFGDSPQPEELATLEKTGSTVIGDAKPLTRAQQLHQSLQRSRRLGQLATALLLVGAVLMLLSGIVAWFRDRWIWPATVRSVILATGGFCLVASVATFALADLASSEVDLWTSLGWRQPAETADAPARSSQAEAVTEGAFNRRAGQLVDWKEQLAPHAPSTRIGQALQQVINKKRGGAAAGIVLISDGCHNAGPPTSRAIAAAREANLPVFVLGVGSDQPPQNVRIGDIQAPPRVFPGDKFKIKTMIQADGMNGQSVRVRLSSVDESQNEAETPEDEQTIRLAADGKPVSLEFELERQTEGRRRYIVRVQPPVGDIDPTDNQRWATVEILQRLTKVLLIAGGPMRDYQFLRNQLYRDPDISLDVWLQMAKPGADQESNELLFEFPKTTDLLFEYDAIVAFDPDWRQLTLPQSRWLERWVSEKAGGLIVIAGPVFTPEWTRQPRGEESIDLIRQLYPVSFYSQGSAILKLGRFGGDQPFPLQFSREGRTAEYLWLADSLAESAANWQRFAGVYGYYAVNEPKAGADVLANFSDPATAIDDRLPIYLASHFYGAGRVIFQASGEVWRLRELEVGYFQRYYLNLIRWVSQGRLLRDSTRGILLVDRNRCWVGDQVEVRAILRDAADEPLLANQVNAVIQGPGNIAETVVLRNLQDAARPGTFSGQFTATREGLYQIRLPVPQSAERQELTAELQASIPDLEKEHPQRNDALLSEIAGQTGGVYFPQIVPAVLENSGLPAQIAAVDQEVFLPGTPDETFTRKSMGWLVIWLTLVLAMEWTIRRLHKLA